MLKKNRFKYSDYTWSVYEILSICLIHKWVPGKTDMSIEAWSPYSTAPQGFMLVGFNECIVGTWFDFNFSLGSIDLLLFWTNWKDKKNEENKSIKDGDIAPWKDLQKKLNKDKRKEQRNYYILIWGGSSSVSIFFTLRM